MAMTYENLPSNFPLGMVFGIAAALAGSLAWGGVAYLLNRIFLYGAFLIGLLVAWGVIKGMGKINLAGQVLVFALTVASVLFGDAIFYTLTAMKVLNQPFSLRLLEAVMRSFVQLESEGSGVASVAFALIGAGLTLYRVRKPKFSVQFEALGVPALR